MQFLELRCFTRRWLSGFLGACCIGLVATVASRLAGAYEAKLDELKLRWLKKLLILFGSSILSKLSQLSTQVVEMRSCYLPVEAMVEVIKLVIHWSYLQVIGANQSEHYPIQ